MIVNHTHRFVFVHVPKAAGSTVTHTLSSFSQYCDQEIGGTQQGEAIAPYMRQRFGLYKHATADEIRDVVGHSMFASYYTFAFVRNPYDRLRSAFEFLRGWDEAPEPIKNSLDSFESYEHFVESNIWAERPGPDNIFRPQTYWLYCSRTGRRIVDFVGKVETLPADLTHVVERITGNADIVIENKNQSRPYDVSDHIDEGARMRIAEYYKDDFQAFGYETPSRK